jgi:hypothetical protein
MNILNQSQISAPRNIYELQTYTPGSDVAVGFNQSQIVWGRTGNNTLLGYQPLTKNTGQLQIDTLIGGVEILDQKDPIPRQQSNTFILGDWSKPYYANGDPSIFGLNDFALIVDFNPAQDIIQLNGTPQDYQLVKTPLGSALLWNQKNVPDAISFFIGNSDLSLEGKYFSFKGYTPASGPVQGQIQQLGTEGFDLTPTIATDPFGNVYVAGGTSGSFGGANVSDSRDALVAKYDSTGNHLWVKQFGSSSFDTIYGIATDNQGNFYVAGTTQGNLGAIKQAANSDAWVAKYDSDGNQQWIQQFGSDIITTAFSIDVDTDSNVYLSGITVEPSDPPAFAKDNFWVTKYDTNGSRQWFTQYGVPDTFSESYGMTVSGDGNIYATGWTLGDLEGKNAGLYDNWIGKFDNNGQLEWIKQFGSQDYDWGWSIATDSNNNAYATGWTLGDLAGKNAGSYDGWLAKYDSKGNQQWIKQFGTPGDDESFHTYIDSNDNIFLTGYTDGNLGGLNAGSYDAWVAAFDIDGNQKWITQFGTPELDEALSIIGDNAGNLYVTGLTEGSLGDLNTGSFDAWIAKLNANSGSLLDFFGTSKPVNDPALLRDDLISHDFEVTGLTDGSLGTANQGSFDAWVVKLNGENSNIENFTDTLNSYIQPQKQGLEILASADTLGRFNQSLSNQTGELFTSVPKDVDLVLWGTNASAQIFNTTPDALANSSSLQNPLSANPTLYGGVEIFPSTLGINYYSHFK